MAADEVEVLGRPRALDHVEPFLRKLVTVVVFALLHAEHLKLAFVPAGHDVEPEAAVTDVVGGDHLLGSDEWMEQRGVNGAEHRDPLCGGEQPTGPSNGLKRGAMKIAVAAVTLPPSDREEEIDAAFVGDTRHLETIRPGCLPTLRHQRSGARGGAVRAKQADFQSILVV